MKYIDNFLNSITMYRLMLYSLLALFGFALIFSIFGIVAFSPLSLIGSLLMLFIVCYGTNYFLAKLFKAPTNVESSAITALILFFVMSPPASVGDYGMLLLVGVLAMASKYILAYRKKHIFNPAAIAVFIVGVFGSGLAIWWVATPSLVIITAFIGFLIVRKIRRFHLFLSFAITALLTISFFGIKNGLTIPDILTQSIFSWPLIFFGTIMLTEPLTTPPTKGLRIVYGAFVGLLFGSQFHVGPVFATPEFALVAGNIFSFIVSPKYKLKLILQEKKQLASDIYEFIFSTPRKIIFSPGQYLEWTLPHASSDGRGNRRYFTVSSSPTEDDIKIGIRFANKPSTFKNALVGMKKGDTLVASQLTGDFTLPKDSSKKLVFIAGGIGITPFRSMIKYLSDTNEKRNIVMFYAASTEDRLVYKDIFDEAIKNMNLKIFYITSGFVTETMIKEHVADLTQRMFYLSGPNAMVTNYKKLLISLGIHRRDIKTDYFPGF